MRNLKGSEDEQRQKDYMPTDHIMDKVEVLHKLRPHEETKEAESSQAIVGSEGIPDAVGVLNEDDNNTSNNSDTDEDANGAADGVGHGTLVGGV
mmetsp:Transcript_28452/g.58222  ORF Transcript_28452/g.58222 Transcript_28452/m.58222 type:complete len:94 (+) Transcript_28452:690-971(+)